MYLLSVIMARPVPSEGGAMKANITATALKNQRNISSMVISLKIDKNDAVPAAILS